MEKVMIVIVLAAISVFSKAEIRPEYFFDKCQIHFIKVTHLVRYTRGVEEPRVLADQSALKNYIPRFLKVYRQLPPAMQKMFCHLREVRIADGERSDSANMQGIFDNVGQLHSAHIEFDRNMLDRHLSLQEWATWKEQLSFGGIRHLHKALSWLPQIDTNIEQKTEGLLFYLLAHEFGHIFDYANKVNEFHNGHPYSEWSQLSWVREKGVKLSSTFPFIEKFCFYWCKEGAHIPTSQIRNAYNGLLNSNFISSYATTTPLDDWAETVSYWALNNIPGIFYSVDFKDEDKVYTYDVIKKFNSESFSAKKKYVTGFFNGNIKYPGSVE
jgi:hypothetical protein